MNIKWLKQNVVIVGIIAAFLIVLGGVIWLQQSAASKRAEVDAALEEQRSQYEHFSTQKPTPSQENINLLKKEREEVDHLYQQLLATVGRSQIPAQADLRPVTFLQQMASQVSRLRQAATNNNVKVAEGFAFGFGRYAGPPPQLPAKGLSDEDTKHVLTLLVKQLHAIEQISLLLISSRVEEINQIRHSEAEPGSGTSSEAFDIPVNNDPKALYQVLPFEFQFTCTGEALRAFLNSLTASEWFFAVRSVKVVGEAPSLSSPTASPAATAATATPTPVKPVRLSVTMRIDLIEFSVNQPPKPEAKKPGA
jgi:Tfp pilus assembly protein PilE